MKFVVRENHFATHVLPQSHWEGKFVDPLVRAIYQYAQLTLFDLREHLAESNAPAPPTLPFEMRGESCLQYHRDTRRVAQDKP